MYINFKDNFRRYVNEFGRYFIRGKHLAVVDGDVEAEVVARVEVAACFAGEYFLNTLQR